MIAARSPRARPVAAAQTVAIAVVVTILLAGVPIIGAQFASSSGPRSDPTPRVTPHELPASSGSVDAVIATIPVGTEPSATAYDPANGNLYVSNSGSDSVSVISGMTNAVVVTIPVGPNVGEPGWYPGLVTPVYDNRNGDLYVASDMSIVTVISGMTNAIVTNISLPGHGCSEDLGATGWYETVPLYDSANGNLYQPYTWSCTLIGQGAHNVSVLSGSTNSVVASLPVGPSPQTPTLDPESGNVYVPNFGANNASVISTTTNSLVATVMVGPNPWTPAYDSANHDLYVPIDNVTRTNPFFFGTGSVSVVAGGTNTVVATIPVGPNPETPAYDPVNGELYVADSNASNVDVISGTTNTVVATIPVGSYPQTPTYDGDNGDLYVANWNSSSVSVISGSTNSVIATIPVGVNPNPSTYDPANGELYVSNFGSDNVSVIMGGIPSFRATFSEAGLPAGANWTVTLNDLANSSASQSISFILKNGIYNYTVAAPSGFLVTPQNGSITIQETNSTVNLVFSVLPPKSGTTPTFLGLTEAAWSVTLLAAAVFATVGILALFGSRKRKRVLGTGPARQDPPTTENRPR